MEKNYFEVSIEDSLGKVTYAGQSYLPYEQSIDLMVRMAKAAKLAAEQERTKHAYEPDNWVKPEEDDTQPQPPKIVPMERPAFRDRLPNQVDIGELDVKQAITENAKVRCPNCGQSHVLAIMVDGNIQFMSKNGYHGDFQRIAVCRNAKELKDMSYDLEKTNPQAYYEDIHKIGSIADPDVAVDNDTSIFCPMCHKEENFARWKKAWDTPLEFFEFENPCECCGGETTVIKADEQDGSVYHQCEVCGHQFKE